MRGPIRLKNLRARFVPFYVFATVALVFMRPHVLGLGVGAGLVLLGSGLRAWGAGHLVKNERLTVTGPYAHVRHPLYAGTLLVASGFAVIAGGVLAVGLLFSLVPWFFFDYFPRKERIESERLAARYGEHYVRYRDAVPALVPMLQAWHPPQAKGFPFDDLDRAWSSERYLANNELGTLIALVAGLLTFGLRAQLGF